MLLDQIQKDLTEAQKARDQIKVDALRFLLGEIKNLEIAKYPPGSTSKLTDEDVISVISKQIKAHKESIEMFKKGGRSDLVASEQTQLSIIQSYMPAQLSGEELRLKLQDLRSGSPGADFGALMKMAMNEFKGKADGAEVSKILHELLQ